MCENCFTEEVNSFTDLKSWNSFDLELTKRLADGKMKELKFINDGKRDKDDGKYIYKCLSCGEEWKLREPTDGLGGYFLKVSSVEKVINKLTIGWIIGLVIFIIIRMIFG
jgi:hypothetical protein